MGIVVGAIYADGKALRTEVNAASRQMEALAGFGITPTDVTSRLFPIETRIKEKGLEPFLDECVAALPPDMRARALRVALDVMVADGAIGEREHSYIFTLASRMGKR